MRKNIHLPHLNYTVKVRPFKTHPDLEACRAWVHMVDRWHSVIYLPAKPNPGLVAHEIVHVLQHLCEARSMIFEREREHTAYLMQYLMAQILGYVWGRK